MGCDSLNEERKNGWEEKAEPTAGTIWVGQDGTANSSFQ